MEILSVLGIIALIAVSGLVIYLLAGLIISIIEKKNVKLFNTEEAKPSEQNEQQLLLQDSSYELNLDDEEEAKEVGEAIDLDAADREKEEIEKQKAALAEREEEIKEDPFAEEEEEEEESLDEMYQKLIADINAEAAQEEPTEATEEEPETEEVVEEPEEVEEEVVEEPVEETVEEEVEEDNNDELQKEIEALKAQLQVEQAEKAALRQELEAQPTTQEVVETESLEALQARLAVLNERLAASEKELKANKKEYLPLARIKKHLEVDKTKLRRKEAVVAKQKVMLFGVNNYVVDPEKEQKLSEDLDVLDALRLSVQHCEEVMKDNEDRYPILENTNKILTKQVADLKADVADIEARIARLNGDGNDAADAE